MHTEIHGRLCCNATRYDKEQSTETMLFWRRRRAEVDTEVCLMFNVYNVHKVILKCIIKKKMLQNVLQLSVEQMVKMWMSSLV